jgi:hypothetical protein
MTPESADVPRLADTQPADRWLGKKFLWLVVVTWLVHLAGVWLFGAKNNPAPRPERNVPIIRLADPRSELMRLLDPTLFARPHPEDFPPALQPALPRVPEPEFRWTEPPPFLPLKAENLGVTFPAFLQKSPLPLTALKFKPEPAVYEPASRFHPALPDESSFQITGELAGRRVLHPPALPAIARNDVLKPSRVQLLVTPDGYGLSATLLDTSEWDTADQLALALARALRFAPTNRMMGGEIIFHWHTVPTNTP